MCTPELPARLPAVDAFLGDTGRGGGAAEAVLSAAVEAGTHLFLEKVSPWVWQQSAPCGLDCG